MARRRFGWAAIYERLGARYHLFLLCLAGVSIPLIGFPAGALIVLSYGSARVSRYLDWLAVTTPIVTAAGVVAELIVWRLQLPLWRWLRDGKPNTGAKDAWKAAVVQLWKAVLFGGTVVAVSAIPAEIYSASQAGFNTAGTLAACVGLTTIIAAGGVLHYFAWEQALRPVVLEIASQLPPAFVSPRRSLSAGGKVLVLLPIMNVLTGFLGVGFSGYTHSHSARIAVGIGVAVGISATISLGLALLLRKSLVGPLKDILNAIRGVDAGDLGAVALRTSADELGEVTRSFNKMVDGLREREQLRQELRESRARIVAAGDASRRQVERDLHDGAQQHIVLLQLKLSLLGRMLEADPKALAIAQDAHRDAQLALTELRDLAHGLYPAVLERDGLGGALADAALRTAIPTEVSCDLVARYRPEVEAAVYFCCLEALQNAAKHAGEHARARVRASEHDGALEFEVSDDGSGFDAERASQSAGLQNMADRIGALGGELRVASLPGAGTTVAAAIPLDRRAGHVDKPLTGETIRPRG